MTNLELYKAKDRILRDPSVRFVVKDMIRMLDGQDPVDAANDAALVAALFDGKCKAILHHAQAVKEEDKR